MPYPYPDLRSWLAEEEALGNVVRIQKSIKCGDYANLVNIDFARYNNVPDPRGEMAGVQPATEMRALVRYLHSLPNCPIGIIENPVDNRPDVPVVVNVWATFERTLRGLGLANQAELSAKLEKTLGGRIKPIVLESIKAPCREVVIREDSLNLTRDLPRIWVEFNKLCFSGCNGTIVCRDPETNTHGLTKTRLGFFDWDNGDPRQRFPDDKIKRYGFATMARPGRPAQGTAGRYYFSRYREKGKNWPAAFVYGLPADYHAIATLKSLQWPKTGDEYEILGSFRGQPLELVPSETIPGLMVPADAEWVIEGEFINEDYRTPSTSEDLAFGFVWGEALWPVFKINCITRRRDAFWDGATFSSLGPDDHEGTHTGIFVAVYADAVNSLRKAGFKVKDVVNYSQWMAVIQLEVDGKDKPRPGYGEEVGRAVAAKYTIVVGPDIDPHNPAEVMWAVGMRAGRAQWRDYPPPPPGAPEIPRYGIFSALTQDMGFQVIDATIPVPERFDTFPPRTEPPAWVESAVRRMKEYLSRS
jgi:3-polyprenyl-4-hydroxybenzoate decarboxylase